MNKKEVLKRIGKDNWEKFKIFMSGQTIGFANGQFDYYEEDVERFMAGLPVVD